MMAEYGSGIFYGRSDGRQNSPTFSQLGIFSLPSELDIGPPIDSTSCKSNSEPGKDLILIAEFSEIEGPIPLLTIPQNNSTDLNLNDFVVQLMSTDYHNMGSSDFQIHEDTCLLQEDTEKGCYTYVHYFTLYDVRARGFVRPMCLAYISLEREKLKRYFRNIRKEFSKATEYLRICNLSLFSKDMATEYLRICNLSLFSKEMVKRIEDLCFTKERFIESQKHFNYEELKPLLPTTSEPLKEKKKVKKSRRKRAVSFSNDMSRPPVTPSSCQFVRDNNVVDKILIDDWDKSTTFSPTVNSNTQRAKELSSSHSLPTTTDTSCSRMRSPSPSSSWSGGERFLSSSVPYSNSTKQSNTLPLRGGMVSQSTDSTRLASPVRPHFYLPPPLPLVSDHCEAVATTESSSKEIFLEASHSSVSSSSTVKSNKDLKVSYDSERTVQGLSPKEAHSISEEISVLQHTSLEALALQILDCQYILQVINNYMEYSETESELDRFLDEVKSSPQSPLYIAMEELGLLPAKSTPEVTPEPTLFVISLMRRSFRNLRPVRSLCSIGYIACIAKLLDTFQRFSRSNLTLLFEDLDRDLYENPFGSLFMGILPVIQIDGTRKTVASVPHIRRFSLSDARWNEDLVRLLRVDPSQASTPDSEYSDARDSFDRDAEIIVADDCLEVFTPTLVTPSMQIVVNGDQNSDAPYQETSVATKSQAVAIKGFSCPPTPIRSTSSDSSWASSTPRDLNLLEGMESEIEEEGEEEEVTSDITDRTAVRIFRYDIAHRMETAGSCRMSAVIQQFGGVSQCIVHSILSGKTMIVAGPEYLRSVVILYTKSLSTILPVKPNDFPPILKWHTGTITPYHLNMYKIIGTCIPERLHVQDLMSNATLNQVTVLNIETGHISGVAYSGSLLYKADQLSRRNFRSDASLQAALQAILISLGMKVFLHFHLLRTTTRTSNQILKGIGIPRGDWLMIQYLTKLVQEQITEEELFS